MDKTITLYESLYNTKAEAIDNESMAEVLECIEIYGTESIYSKNKAPLFSPVELHAGRTRCNDAIKQINFLVYDIDQGNVTEHDFDQLPYENITYRSFSYTPAKPKYRLLLTISEPITNLDTFKHIWAYVGDVLKAQYNLIIDTQCSDLSRGYYLPCINMNTGSQPNIIHRPNDGLTIDLSQIPPPPPPVTIPKPVYNPPSPNSQNTYSSEKPYYNELWDNNIISLYLTKKINTYSNLSDGEHYTKFYGLITSVRNHHYKKFGTEIDCNLLEQIMCDIDNTTPCGYQYTKGYGINHIRKKIDQNIKNQPIY